MNSAAAILAVPLDQPERLFRLQYGIAERYRELAKVWHPDVNSDPAAGDVFAHIGRLRVAALERAAKGIWNPPGLIEITDRYGKRFRLTYRARRKFEMGEMLIGMGIVTFIIPRRHESLVLNGLGQIGRIGYPSKDFQKSLERYMPKVERAFETKDDWVVCIRKEHHEVLLADLITHLGGKIEPKHTAWIISSLLNLACFLEVSNMTLNALSPSTVFVSPQKHAVSLYGGWWYAQKGGGLLSHLPPETLSLASPRLKATKIAQAELDLVAIKAIGRACLGDLAGGSLRTRPDIPSALSQFLLLPPAKSAIKEYGSWPKVLEDSFGPRRYHELKITGDDVYPEGAING